MKLVVIVLALAGGGWLFSRFLKYERQGRREMVFAAVVAVLLLDSLLYTTQNDVPNGLFHPYIGSESFRLPELFIVLGLTARLVVHGLPKRVTPAGLAWTFFAVWYLFSGVLGRLYGNPGNLVNFQGKAIIYICGGLALATGVPVARIVRREAIGKWFVATGAIVAVMIPVTLAHVTPYLNLPGLTVRKLGDLGPDGASVLVGTAVIVLLIEGCRKRQRAVIGLAGLAMLFGVFAPSQRAALLGLVASAAVVLAASVGPTWRNRMKATPTQFGLALCGLAVVGLTITLVRVEQRASLPLAEEYDETFNATKKQQSADSRVLLWKEGSRLFDQRPILGWGLGKEFFVPKIGSDELSTSGGFHNLGYDLGVRSGVIGVVLFLVATGSTLAAGWRAWQRHPNPRVAALALGCIAVACGILVKGMVESVTEKHRLATLLGLVFGLALSAARSSRREGVELDELDEPGPHLAASSRKVHAWN